MIEECRALLLTVSVRGFLDPSQENGKGNTMTRLLQQAFTTVATNLSPASQDRLAHLMMENVGRLEEALEGAWDEQVFEASAIQAMESDKVRDLLKRVAQKHGSERGLATESE